MATWKLAFEVVQFVVHARGLLHLGNDPEGERVASDPGKVLAEQVSSSLSIAGGSGADDLDVVAFPVHLTSSVTLA